MNTKKINKINKLISHDKISEAIKSLVSILEDTPDKPSDLLTSSIAQAVYYKHLEQNHRLGLISRAEFSISKNKVVSSILNLVQKLEEESDSHDLNSPLSSLSKINILFLSATYKNTDQLWLEKEYRMIEEELRNSNLRDKFNITKFLPSKITDIYKGFIEYTPNIVHFSGHGAKQGIYFRDFDGNEVLVNNNTLGGLFQSFSKSIQCVILNSCYSESQADLISKYVPYVIGVKENITDEMAIKFTSFFYKKIGSNISLEDSYMQSKNEIELIYPTSPTQPQFVLKTKQ